MDTFKKLTRDELKKMMDDKADFVLIDTLGEMSYNKAHLPGAVSIDAHEDNFADNVKEHVSDMSKNVIVYCASFTCKLSPQAAQKLVDAGFENVHDYEGGLQDWAQGGYSLEGEEAELIQENLSKL